MQRVVKFWKRKEGYRTGLLVEEGADYDTVIYRTPTSIRTARVPPMEWREIPYDLDKALEFFRAKGARV